MKLSNTWAAVALSILLAVPTSATAVAAEPIRIGALASLSGPMSLPEAPAAARAVFDRVNAAGGIQGRQIDYLVEDDKGDASSTAQAARDLVDSKGVVAFAGSASLQDCTVDSGLYKQRGVLSIPGVGGEFGCYRNKSFAPVSVGPARGVLASLMFASTQLKKDRICAFLLGIPAHGVGNKWAVENFTALTGKTLQLVDTTVLPNDDMTPHVLKARKAGCDAIVFSGTEQMDMAWYKAMKTQGITDETIVFLTPAYTTTFAAQFGKTTDTVYANSEFEPFLGSSPVLADWRALMAANHVPESSFAQGGYVSASLLVTVLRRIHGPITRESVTAALRQTQGGDAIPHPMLGQAFSFAGDVDVMKSSATKFVRLKDGKWDVVTPEFFITTVAK